MGIVHVISLLWFKFKAHLRQSPNKETFSTGNVPYLQAYVELPLPGKKILKASLCRGHPPTISGPLARANFVHPHQPTLCVQMLHPKTLGAGHFLHSYLLFALIQSQEQLRRSIGTPKDLLDPYTIYRYRLKLYHHFPIRNDFGSFWIRSLFQFFGEYPLLYWLQVQPYRFFW